MSDTEPETSYPDSWLTPAQRAAVQEARTEESQLRGTRRLGPKLVTIQCIGS